VALGCITYEFLVGITPFYAESVQEIFQNILNYIIEWPNEEEVSPAAQDLISKLLIIDPSKRLGRNGAEEVKNHSWFSDVTWTTLLEQEALFVPQTDDITDLSYFEARQELYPMGSVESYANSEEGVPDAFGQRFRKFTFVNYQNLGATNKTLTPQER